MVTGAKPPEPTVPIPSPSMKWKIKMLEQLETKPLIEQLAQQQANLEKIQKDELKFKADNRGYLAAADEDCPQVKTALAGLWLDAPSVNVSGKNATQADKEAWLRQQRTANVQLADFITRQHHVLAGMEEFRLNTETAKRKIEATLALVHLRTAQIQFLAGGA